MNLENYYWYSIKAFSNDFCDKVIKTAKLQKPIVGLTGDVIKLLEEGKKPSKKIIKNLHKQRNSNIVWLENQWIYDAVYPMLYKANQEANWNFSFDWSEPCQFTKYSKGQFYDWHCDSFYKPFDKDRGENFVGKIRKLSCTISLSDPKDYKGGELEFDFRNDKKPVPFKKCIEILPRGSICIFPSFVWHRVRPVTKGTRYSLVIWTLGKPFI